MRESRRQQAKIRDKTTIDRLEGQVRRLQDEVNEWWQWWYGCEEAANWHEPRTATNPQKVLHALAHADDLQQVQSGGVASFEESEQARGPSIEEGYQRLLAAIDATSIQAWFALLRADLPEPQHPLTAEEVSHDRCAAATHPPDASQLQHSCETEDKINRELDFVWFLQCHVDTHCGLDEHEYDVVYDAIQTACSAVPTDQLLKWLAVSSDTWRNLCRAITQVWEGCRTQAWKTTFAETVAMILMVEMHWDDESSVQQFCARLESMRSASEG